MIRSAIFAALLFAGANLSATTTYLMIESPFGTSSTPTTYEFAVQYSANQLLTGQQLLESVFGMPDLSSTGGVAVNNHTYTSTNTIDGVQYAAQYGYSSGFGYFVDSFSIGGQQGGQGGVPDLSFFWGYFNAGGGYNDTSGFTNPPVGPYASGSWSFANTGGDGRTLADQSGTGASSFDAWVFGDGDDSQFPSVSPTVGDFAGATLINIVSPTVTSNTANLAASAVSFVIQGTNFGAGPANNSVTFNLGASGVVTAATATSLTVSFTVQPTSTGSLTAVVTTDSVSSGAPVQVATVVKSYVLGTPTLTEANGAGTDTVVLAVTPASATWTATANNTWLHTSASGTGSAVATFTFDANTAATRTGTVTIAGQTLTVTQAGSTYVAANPVTALVSTNLSMTNGVAVDGAGNVYIADTNNEAIKEWTAATNTVSTLVSTGLNQPSGVAVDGAGNVYIADAGNNAIEKWTAATQTVSTLVSTGLSDPVGVAVDSAGNVYIADATNNAVKKWTAATQTVSTLVSTGLSDPVGVAVDSAGNVYIADATNNAVKKWTAATQTVSTLVSTGLSDPVGVAVDSAGNVYIADATNNAVKKWTAATQTVSTLVSTGLSNPQGVAVDGSGNVYFSDSGNNAIKELPRAFVDPTAKSESRAAGSDALSVVLPATENLLPPFAPSSDQSWLTFGSIAGGVVNFNFTADIGAARIAHITLLGQSIAVTQPPSFMTSAATEVSSGWATLNGEADPEGQDTVAYFQFGTGTNYGNTTAPLDLGSGSSAVPVSYNINGLTKGTTYHFRLVVVSGGIIYDGTDQTFTTPATTSPPNWHSAQITALTNSNPMPMADGARTGVADSSLPLYFYKGTTDNNMWCVYLNGSNWSQTRLSSNANVSDWLTFGTKYNLCCYQAQDNTLWCTYLNGSQWSTVQLGNLPQDVTVAGDVVMDNAWNFIYYRGSDSNIYAVQLIGSQWVHSSLGGTANVKSSLAVDATNHLIYYLGTDNQLWCYQWTGKVWQQVLLGSNSNIAGPLAVDTAGLLVYYRSSTDNTPWCDYWTGKVWSQVQLSTTGTINSSATTFSNLIPYLSQHIALYLDGNGQAESLYLSGGAWAHGLLGDGGSLLTGGFSMQPANDWLFARRSDGNVVIFYYQ